MKNLKICLVDDDMDDKELFQDAFNEVDSENELKIFDNGLEVIQYLDKIEEIPHIIFLDLNMPVMGGLETLREIRKNNRYENLSVAIYSTSSAEKDIEETLVAGANIYITKPSNYECLKKAIAKVLKINWQYHSSELSHKTFVLAV